MSYAVDDTDQLDLDLASFLDYSWSEKVSIETFITGFHARLDKLAELNLNSKLQGHLMLRQANLNRQSRSIIFGAASGSYEVRAIANALRQAYRNNALQDSSMFAGEKPNAKEEVEDIKCFHCKKVGHLRKIAGNCRRATATPAKEEIVMDIAAIHRRSQSMHLHPQILPPVRSSTPVPAALLLVRRRYMPQ